MIEFYNLTFRELKTQPDRIYRDPYNIASSLCKSMKEAVLNNPSGYKEDETCQILALDDDVVVGCTNPYSGRIYIDKEVLPTQSGSYLFSHEDYRKDNVGGELFLRIANLPPSKNCFFSGISQMAIGLYRVLKFTIFEFPRMIYLRKSRSVIQSILKTDSPIIYPIIWGADACLAIHRWILKISNKESRHGYEVVESKTVPQEVEDIILNDPHPFAEYHNKEWLEWNLNYSLTDEPRIKKLFLIKKNNVIEAFFVTKQQFFEQASSRGFKNIYLGSVMEWGISPDSQLTEKDINLIAIHHFDRNIDGIQVATTDELLAKTLKRYLFVPIGCANVGVRLKSIKDPRIKDINNWRLRVAGSDTLMN